MSQPYQIIFLISLSLFVTIFGYNNGLAQTPYMGWNSWYAYGCSVNDTVVRNITLTMKNKGFLEAGKNLHDCHFGSPTKTFLY